MNGNPIRGAVYLLRGFNLIYQPGIRRYVIIPLFINTVLFSLLIYYGASQFNLFIDWLIPPGFDWLSWLLWPLFAAAALIIVLFTFTLLANLIGAPFNGLLAEAVERQITRERPEPQNENASFISQIPSALFSEMKKIFYFVSWSIPLLLLFLVPLLNVTAPFLWMGFNAWMLALEYSDYPMGNHGLMFTDQRSRLRKKHLTVLGFGGAAMILIMIPFVNFIAMPTAVAGATLMWVEEFSESQPKV